ncbi:MAG TPA: hypothetical protein DCQ31_08525 [Bacteroidales bacterium]|nr:hypothetical protein [Bacteroidales bacterium]
MLNYSEIQRYNRHIIMSEIGLAGQEKLKNSKVLVIGAGGLGSPILLYLAAAGIGTIGIADFDTVSESNLQRQVLFSIEDLGKPKSKTAAEKLSKLNSFTAYNVYASGISVENVLAVFAEYDVIIDGSDNFATRYLTNDACVMLNKPLVFGAIFKFYGQVSVFNYLNGPTYRCLFPEQPETNEVPNCSTIGVLGAVPGIIGAMQAAEALKIILEVGEVLSGKLFQMDLLNLSFDIFTIEKNEANTKITELGTYGITCDSSIEPENSWSVSVHELQQKIVNKEIFEIIDLRTEHQYTDYNLGGENITANALFEKPSLAAIDKTIIFVCEYGEQSAAVTEYFSTKLHYNNCFNLTGGIQAWIKAGFELKIKK